MNNHASIKDLITEKISGEWGSNPSSNKAVRVIRTTNFTNEGKLNLKNVVQRDITESKVKAKQLIPGDIIIEKSGGSPNQPVGRVVYFDVNDGDTYLCNNFTSILRPSPKVYPKYLFYSLYFLHFNKKTLNYQNKTTGIINLQLDRYINTEKIILPTYDEQRKIAEKLDQADTIRQKRKQSLNLLKEYLDSVYLEMFGDPVNNSKKWDSYKLGDLLSNIDSGWSPKCLEVTAPNDKWGVLKLSAITSCNYIEEKNKQLPDSFQPKPNIEVKKGDVLFSRKNTYDLIAATAYVFNTRPKLMLSDLIFRLKIKDTSVIKPEFLWKTLTHPGKRKEIQKLAGGASGSMPNISKEKLKNVYIMVPPVGLQNKFTQIVNDTEILKEKMKMQSMDLDINFQSIMQSSFHGKVQ